MLNTTCFEKRKSQEKNQQYSISSNVLKAYNCFQGDMSSFLQSTQETVPTVAMSEYHEDIKVEKEQLLQTSATAPTFSDIQSEHNFTSAQISYNEDVGPSWKNDFVIGPRRRKLSYADSVCSVPASTISAFSAFRQVHGNCVDRQKRTTFQLILNSSIMFGREFCYAVEAGLTTPILLSIGLPFNMYSLVWIISPILGFVLQPIVGNLSDRCSCGWGKRRPFILGLALLLLLGITLLLNSEQIVGLFDKSGEQRRPFGGGSVVVVATIAITVIGVVVFDFSADFIEGPVRAYAMDVCDEEDIQLCLLYQAVFTGAGGALGYASGGISWVKDTKLSLIFPTDRQVVYTAAAFIFTLCCICNLLSISESVMTQFYIKRQMDVRNQATNRNRFEDKVRDDNRFHQTAAEKQDLTCTKELPKNIIKSTNKDTRHSETSLLRSLMSQHRNQLFEQYEKDILDRLSPMDNYHEQIQVQIPKKHLEKIPNPVHQNKSLKKIYRRKRLARNKWIRKNHKAGNNAYGTFASLKPVPRPLLYNSDVADETAPPYNYICFQNPILEKYLQHPDDVLAARAIFSATAPNRRHEKKLSYAYNDSDSSYSDAPNFKSIELLPYAPVDPALKHFLHLPGAGSRHNQDHFKKTNVKSNTSAIETNHFEPVSMSVIELEIGNKDEMKDIRNSNDKTFENVGGLKSLLHSIATMPKDLRYLCVCHFLGWCAFLSMALFFTDFVGQVVMHGDPRSPRTSRSADLYRRGVQIGNWGLTINAAASAIYCVFLKALIKTFGPRTMYIFGYFAFSLGACIVAAFPNVPIVLALSSVIGIMSATLYTLPYFLVAQYHEKYKNQRNVIEERGIGTDCALVTCTIQLAQIVIGLGIGALVNLMNTTTVTIATSSIIAFVGTLWAAFCVHY